MQDTTVKFYIKQGASRDKLVLGIPTYGRSYQLVNPDAHEIGSPTDGPGKKGPGTKEDGYLAYYEVIKSLAIHLDNIIVSRRPIITFEIQFHRYVRAFKMKNGRLLIQTQELMVLTHIIKTVCGWVMMTKKSQEKR